MKTAMCDKTKQGNNTYWVQACVNADVTDVRSAGSLL